MSFAYRNEPDLSVAVYRPYIRDAVCQSVTYCTFSLMGVDQLGLNPGDFETWLDERTGEVRVMWPKDGRRHDGVLEPNSQAMRILILTDQSKEKARLARSCPADGIDLVITQHRSRSRQTSARRTPEQLEAEQARRAELTERRALSPDDPRWLPPAVKRGSHRRLGTVRRRSAGLVRMD